MKKFKENLRNRATRRQRRRSSRIAQLMLMGWSWRQPTLDDPYGYSKCVFWHDEYGGYIVLDKELRRTMLRAPRAKAPGVEIPWHGVGNPMLAKMWGVALSFRAGDSGETNLLENVCEY